MHVCTCTHTHKGKRLGFSIPAWTMTRLKTGICHSRLSPTADPVSSHLGLFCILVVSNKPREHTREMRKWLLSLGSVTSFGKFRLNTNLKGTRKMIFVSSCSCNSCHWVQRSGVALFSLFPKNTRTKTINRSFNKYKH